MQPSQHPDFSPVRSISGFNIHDYNRFVLFEATAYVVTYIGTYRKLLTKYIEGASILISLKYMVGICILDYSAASQKLPHSYLLVVRQAK